MGAGFPLTEQFALIECFSTAYSLTLLLGKQYRLSKIQRTKALFSLFLTDMLVNQFTSKSAVALILVTAIIIFYNYRSLLDAIYSAFVIMATLCLISILCGQIIYLLSPLFISTAAFSLFMSAQLIICTYAVRKMDFHGKSLVITAENKKILSCCLALVIIPVTSATPETQFHPALLSLPATGLIIGLFVLIRNIRAYYVSTHHPLQYIGQFNIRLEDYSHMEVSYPLKLYRDIPEDIGIAEKDLTQLILQIVSYIRSVGRLINVYETKESVYIIEFKYITQSIYVDRLNSSILARYPEISVHHFQDGAYSIITIVIPKRS